MKSSPKIHSQTDKEQFQPWNPSEIGNADPSTDLQRKQLLAIFRSEAEGDVAQSGDRLGLYKAGAGHDFNTWQPGEMITKPGGIRKAEWIFFGSDTIPIRGAQQPQKFEFEVLKESALQDQQQQDEETLTVLELARTQAEEIILAAQGEADQVLLQAQEEIDEQKKEAYQQGRNEAVGELEDALRATRTMVEEVRNWKTELMSQGERIMLDMLVEIAQKIFGEGVELNPEALQINLNRIMESAHGLGDLNIFMNPQDVKTLDPSWSEYQMLVSGDRVKVIPSGKITRGGCFIKGIMGSVDGRVETQLGTILKTFENDSELAE